MAEKKQKYAAGKYVLRASTKHPMRKYRLLDKVVGAEWAEYSLNDAEAKELGGIGCSKWLEVGTQKDLDALRAAQRREKPAPGKAPAEVMAAKIAASEQKQASAASS